VHMARPEGTMIPFETWNLFYRTGQLPSADTA